MDITHCRAKSSLYLMLLCIQNNPFRSESDCSYYKNKSVPKFSVTLLEMTYREQ